MPTYLYECPECGNQQIVKHSITEEPGIQCPVCDFNDVCFRVVTGGTGVIFKEGNDAESSKPDSYWTNAEENRLKNQRKRVSNDWEKLRYKEKSVVQNLENVRASAEAQGNIGKAQLAENILDGKGG